MASVVHNKKKRDKKKKIEDETEEVLLNQPAASVTAAPFKVDESNIHIHKEATTGGGLCAKLIFFVVLTLLTSLIGVIITSHRGLTDLDTINTESAFAHIFDGWIDKSPDVHEETFSAEHSQEDEEEEDEEGHSHSLHDDDEDHSEPEISEEEEENQTETEEQTQEEEEEDYSKILEEEKEEDQESRDDSNEDAETQEKSTEKDVESEVNEEESESSVISKEKEEAEEDKEDEYFKKDMVNRLRSKIPPQNNKRDKYTITNSKANEIESKELDSDDAPEEDEPQETVKQDDTVPVYAKRQVETDDNKTPVEINSESEKESSNMVVRFGVGTALLVVAHVVLIKKWRTARVAINTEVKVEDDESLGPDLSRRNTIIVPPTLETIGHDFEHAEEDYSEEEDYDSEEENNIKREYQELQSAYSNNLTPHWEPKQFPSNCEDEEEEEDMEDEEEGYDEDEEDPDEEDRVEEDHDEEARDEESNDEISENEDEQLLRRLEAKYGILRQNVSAPNIGDYEEDDDEEEEQAEEDEEQNDDDDVEAFEEDGSTSFDHWKRGKFTPIRDSDSEDENHWSNERSGAQNVYDLSNITNSDDWKIREELDRTGKNLANG